MARCNDCNKFCALDSDADPEMDLSVDERGEVTYQASITNVCAECGTDITKADFDGGITADQISGPNPVTGTEVTLADYLAALEAERAEVGEDAPEVEIEVEEGDMERTSRSEGKGRGTKTFYGFRAGFDVKVTYGAREATFSGQAEDEIQASSMDDAQ